MKKFVNILTFALLIAAPTQAAQKELICGSPTIDDVVMRYGDARKELSRRQWKSDDAAIILKYDVNPDKPDISAERYGDQKPATYYGKTVHIEKGMFTSTFEFDQGFAVYTVFISPGDMHLVITSHAQVKDKEGLPRVQTEIFDCESTKKSK